MSSRRALMQSNLRGFTRRGGKVRDVYDLGDRLVLVATDRISAFDWILPAGIPDKGRVLTALSLFWFKRFQVPNHLIDDHVDRLPNVSDDDRSELEGRVMIVKKAHVIPFECVVRGYLAGSGWKEYRDHGTVCGAKLASGLKESDAIDPPIFTPATKAETGHDENISFDRMIEVLGSELAERLRDLSVQIYTEGAEFARSRGLILADTKFEWGTDLKTGELMLVDEVLTPDSSRYWDASGYKPGGPQPSFDKQFVRDWLETTGWDKASPPPPVPSEIVDQTRNKYIQAYKILTGNAFPWS